MPLWAHESNDHCRLKCWECGVKKKAPCGQTQRDDLPWCCHRRLGEWIALHTVTCADNAQKSITFESKRLLPFSRHSVSHIQSALHPHPPNLLPTVSRMQQVRRMVRWWLCACTVCCCRSCVMAQPHAPLHLHSQACMVHWACA